MNEGIILQYHVSEYRTSKWVTQNITLIVPSSHLIVLISHMIVPSSHYLVFLFTSHMIVLLSQLWYLVPSSNMMVPYITYNGT
jgi:hypothetical protein